MRTILFLVILSGCGRYGREEVKVCMHPDLDERALRAFESAVKDIEFLTCDIFEERHKWGVCKRDDSLTLISKPVCKSGRAYSDPMRARIPNAGCNDSEDFVMKLAAHELIHALGIGHSENRDSIMHHAIGEGEYDQETIDKIIRLWCYNK